MAAIQHLSFTKLFKYIAILTGSYVGMLLLFSIPFVKGGYADMFNVSGRMVFNAIGCKEYIFFKGREKAPSANEIQLVLQDGKLFEQKKEEARSKGLRSLDFENPIQTMNVNFWLMSIMPYAFLLALILASPVNPKRMAWAAFWGTMLIHGFIFLELGIKIIYAYNNDPGLDVAQLSPFWKHWLERIWIQLTGVSSGMIIGVAIWLVVCFRKTDWVPAKPRKN